MLAYQRLRAPPAPHGAEEDLPPLLSRLGVLHDVRLEFDCESLWVRNQPSSLARMQLC